MGSGLGVPARVLIPRAAMLAPVVRSGHLLLLKLIKLLEDTSDAGSLFPGLESGSKRSESCEVIRPSTEILRNRVVSGRVRLILDFSLVAGHLGVV